MFVPLEYAAIVSVWSVSGVVAEGLDRCGRSVGVVAEGLTGHRCGRSVGVVAEGLDRCGRSVSGGGG